MSDNILKLIPTVSSYVPTEEAWKKACALFSEYMSDAEAVTCSLLKGVEFIDQGQNWERVTCPFCGQPINEEWWAQSMDHSYQTGFSDLTVSLPCCERSSSLDALIYEWPAGFARAVLEARNPKRKLDAERISILGQVLGCQLRTIWARY
jgi:hypothetical protein